MTRLLVWSSIRRFFVWVVEIDLIFGWLVGIDLGF